MTKETDNKKTEHKVLFFFTLSVGVLIGLTAALLIGNLLGIDRAKVGWSHTDLLQATFSGLSVVIAALAAWYVAKTLRVNSKAVEAAHEAVSLQKLEMQPMLFPKAGQLEETSDETGLRLNITNYGKKPAFNVIAKGWLVAVKNIKLTPPLDLRRDIKDIIAPGETKEMVAVLRKDMRDAESFEMLIQFTYHDYFDVKVDTVQIHIKAVRNHFHSTGKEKKVMRIYDGHKF